MKIRFPFKKVSHIGFVIAVILMAIMLASVIIENGIAGLIPIDDSGIDLKNFAIEDLTDEQIINTSARNSAYMSRISRRGNGTGVEGRRYAEADKDSVEYSAQKVVGLDVLITGKASSGVMKFDIDVELESGAAEIVVIRDDRIVERLAAQDVTLAYDVSEESVFYVKLLYEDAKISIKATREITK